MADNPISKSDIISPDVEQAIKDITATLQNLSKIMNEDLKVSADALNKALQGVNVSTKEGQEIVKSASQQAEFLAAQQKELTRLDKDRIGIQAKINTATSKQAQENARLKVSLERTNRAQKEAAKINQSAQGSIDQMKAKLKTLIAEYNALAPAMRDKAAPAIKKLTDELKKAEGAIGNNTRSVGSYTGSIIAAGKQLIGFTGVVGLVIGAFNQLKNSFTNTEFGFTKMKQVGAIWKQFWYDLVENQKVSYKNLVIASSEAQQTAKIELEDRKDLVAIAKLENEIAVLRYKSETQKGQKQLDLIDQALAKEEELIKFKRADLQEELDNVNVRLKIAATDISLLNKKAQIEADMERLEGDRNLRLITRSVSARNMAEKEAEKEAERAKKIMDAANMMGIQKVDITAKAAIKTGYIRDNELKQNKELADEQQRIIKATSDYEIAERQRVETEKYEITQEFLNQSSTALNVFSDLFAVAKQRELSAVGDNAVAREEIERKYAKRQQILSIGQALINGAMAITEIQKKWAWNPVTAGILTALNVAQTIAQVAVIKGQKFAKGGSGILEGAMHASGGIQIAGVGEAEGGEHIAITSRTMTSKYGGGMLDAVSNSINQGKFFEVWSNVNKGMGVSNDPYTKKMYELMKGTPTIYTDSTGATVKEYADGRKVVIKKMQFFKN